MPTYRVKPGHKYFDCRTSTLYVEGDTVTYDRGKQPFRDVGENLEEVKGKVQQAPIDAALRPEEV